MYLYLTSVTKSWSRLNKRFHQVQIYPQSPEKVAVSKQSDILVKTRQYPAATRGQKITRLVVKWDSMNGTENDSISDEVSNMTKQKVSVARKHIENHYKEQIKSSQERRER
ncbi:hypothetical protein HanPSC8_Chr08g0347831 [Helianthus annuus]|nr:hypothetical protein HanPSC8_Chr08g0347831 [Helianthus annuus]